MMRSSLFLIASLFLGLGTGCKARSQKRWAEREQYVQECRARWQRQATTDTLRIRVIYAQNSFPFMADTLPNFLIGTNYNGDTLGFVDMLWPSDSTFADTMLLLPSAWTNEAMAQRDPANQVFADRKINSLYCGVRMLYYGRLLQP